MSVSSTRSRGAATRDTGAIPFSFGADAARPLAALPALDRMNERAARRLRQRLEPISRIKPRVTAEPIVLRRFDAWKADQPEFTSVSLYRFRPLKGGVLVSIDPELVGRLVDAFYGGPGIYGERLVKEFSPTEERLLTRLSEALVDTLTEMWSEVIPVKAQLSSRETNIGHAGLVAGDEPVAIARFTVALGPRRPCAIDILYPSAALRAVEANLSVKIHDDTGMTGSEWRERISAALGEVRLQARSVLARPTLSVAELLSLKPGDVIPISMPQLVPLLVSGREIAVGRIGEQDGRAAIQIEHVEGRGTVQ
ncbi:flagellar motor switch protein FliM [Allosphingosinicella deserti]|uniref:Flagellar motor switch protein FliM n=1 Tax=Allosphingosinicella deserti TaxID=2116704 RepID=A0A2P7QNY4_9SPHN|nr:FliM/FliN family flagellar motor switch protein [Sphingomonas deserti]PSJ39679.1 flagellar motor switch protein FliM [Sphingomonas deserti]